MHRRKLTVLALAAIAVAAIGLTGASAATGQHGRFQTISGGTISSSSSKFVPLALSNKPVTYILEMSAKPVAAVVAASKLAGHRLSYAQKATLTRQIRAQQAPVIAAVNRLHGALVTERYQGVYNGIAVTLPQREAWKLSSINGVKAVFATKTFKMASIAPGNGIPLTNAPQTWSGYNGTGMKIADLDTGLDYTHADFGGTGTTAAFDCADAHSTEDLATFQASCPGVTDWSTGTKVKGGTDLVGDAYNASGSGGALIPHPDPNPLDCNGHGSHTAGTAAGFGVDGSGNTYTGSYDANTFDNSFIIPPGVAPKADLYAVRVFGCSGSVNDDVLLAAMDWAFTNGMDVVNMSLGSSFGSNSDPDAVAVNNLTRERCHRGHVVGQRRSEPVHDGLAGRCHFGPLGRCERLDRRVPGRRPDALDRVRRCMSAIVANGATVAPVTYNAHVIWNNPANHALGISLGCSVAADEASNGGNPYASTDILIVARGTCARVAKAIYGQQAGAGAVIMVNNSTALPPYEGPITTNPDNGAAYTVTIPFFGVTGGSSPSNVGQRRGAQGGRRRHDRCCCQRRTREPELQGSRELHVVGSVGRWQHEAGSHGSWCEHHVGRRGCR